MRNLFDQYRQPENQLSHALGVCLDEDRTLLRAFLARVGVRPPKPARALIVDEQRLPGEDEKESTDEDPEDEARRRGLPDLVIHDGQRWVLIVENKINARLTVNQLERHMNTLQGRAFTSTRVLALTRRGTIRSARMNRFRSRHHGVSERNLNGRVRPIRPATSRGGHMANAKRRRAPRNTQQARLTEAAERGRRLASQVLRRRAVGSALLLAGQYALLEGESSDALTFAGLELDSEDHVFRLDASKSRSDMQ